VRNLPDGDVEVHAEGPEESLAGYLSWLEKGPPYSRVDKVESRSIEPRGYVSFDIED